MTESMQDPLPAALLPVVIHELNNATQLLTSLNAVLSIPGGTRFLSDRAGDMTSVGEEVHDLGWLMAALATASGDDLLLARRHAFGLDVMVHHVRKALRREGHDLTQAEGRLPRISNAMGQGWEVAWSLGSFLLLLGREAPEALDWNWTRGETDWIFESDRELQGAALLEALLCDRLGDTELASEVELQVREGCTRLRISARLLEES